MNDRDHIAGLPNSVPNHLKYPKFTLGDLLFESAEKYPNLACIKYESQSYNFRQVDQITDRVADGLIALGFKKGDRIGILLPNIPQFIFSFFGILKMGGVVVAINPNYQFREIQNQVNKVGVSGLFILSAHLDLTENLHHTTAIHNFIYSDLDESLSLTDVETEIRSHTQKVVTNYPNAIRFKNLLTIQRTNSFKINNKITHEQPAILQFSGGTTGVPKAAVGLHCNVVANVYQFRAWLNQMEDVKNPFLVAIPLFHVYGMVLGMVLAILMGCPMILINNPGDVQKIFKAIRKFKPTIFPSVPSQLYAMLHHTELNAYKNDIKSLKICISGSASLNPEIKSNFEQLISGPLIEGYGLSEAPSATHCNPVTGINKTGSIGLPLPDVECHLVSLENGNREVVTGRLGELVIRGPQIMKEYYGNPEETEIAIKNGWLYTGDIAWKDNDGYYFIKGRKKDLIKVGGLQVWPQEVEEVISLLPGVKESAAAGIPDDFLGEVVIVWVVMKPESNLTAQEVFDHCRKNLARHKVPVKIKILENLPRSTIGKVLRQELIRLEIEKKD
jgi:long-chain acyl-CoA synthetase